MPWLARGGTWVRDHRTRSTFSRGREKRRRDDFPGLRQVNPSDTKVRLGREIFFPEAGCGVRGAVSPSHIPLYNYARGHT